MLNITEALDQLFVRWQAHCDRDCGEFPVIDHDPQWPSECEIPGSQVNGQVQWQAQKRRLPGDFSNIEAALEIRLHDDIKIFFSRYFSGELDLRHAKGPVTLLQVWNDEDFANLQENMIGHIMMKRQLKQPITLFFALTDQDEQIISLLNDSGEVWLENVGQQPHLKLADSMAAFLAGLNVPA